MKKRDGFYNVEDVMRILDVCEKTAYKRIQEMNMELEAKGFMIRKGMIPKKYFKERYAL